MSIYYYPNTSKLCLRPQMIFAHESSGLAMQGTGRYNYRGRYLAMPLVKEPGLERWHYLGMLAKTNQEALRWHSRTKA